jgi:protein-histidine pros-kinase
MSRVTPEDRATVEPEGDRRGDVFVERTVRDLLDAAPDAMVVVDWDGHIVLANVQAEALFGYARLEMLGASVDLLLPQSLRARHVEHRAAYRAEPRLRPMGAGLDLVARRRDGSEFAVEISLSPVRTAQGTFVTASVRDITERKRLEAEKDELLAIAEQARAEEARAREARAETERLKDDLAGMVVHDLKNPVNGILMMVQLSLRKGNDLPGPHQRRLRQIEMTCGEMMRLIQNLLEISKIEEGKMPIAREPVALAEVVDEVQREYAPVAEQTAKRLAVRPGAEAAVAIGDPSLIKRVLINLVVNALRHSGSREVWVEAVPDAGAGTVTLRVIDTGHGIAPEDQVRIFEKFAVVRRSLGDPAGDTGLGLPFCKLAVERMGGRITLTSVPGEQTVFAVTLPAQQSAGC